MDYVQSTVCSGVKKNLIQRFTETNLPVLNIYHCVRCKAPGRSLKDEICRFLSKAFRDPIFTQANFQSDFRRFTQQGMNILVDFSYNVPPAASQKALPALWNRKCAIEMLRSLAVRLTQSS